MRSATGNHSLAAAKAHWENVRASGCPAARYALCEIVDISEPSIEFEPIYRIVKNCNVPDFLSALEALSGDGEQKVTALYGGCEKEFSFAAPTHALTVGTLQNFIDSYIEAHPGAECDYIHGTDSLRALSAEKDCVGFIFDGMSKDELFPYGHGARSASAKDLLDGRRTFKEILYRSARHRLTVGTGINLLTDCGAIPAKKAGAVGFPFFMCRPRPARNPERSGSVVGSALTAEMFVRHRRRACDRLSLYRVCDVTREQRVYSFFFCGSLSRFSMQIRSVCCGVKRICP